MKYNIRLNDNVTPRMLKDIGFIIEDTKNFIWAVKHTVEKPKNGNVSRGSLIIKMDPPERRIMFRYQIDDEELDLLEHISFMKGMFKVLPND